MSITPEMLAAYADGELGPEDIARVETAIADNPALASQVEAHRALRERLSAHFAPILDMPIPDNLKRPLEAPAQVVDLAAARRAKDEKAKAPVTLPRWVMGSAIAASLAIGLVVGGQFSGGGMIADDNGRVVASGALDRALSNQLASSQASDAPVHILLSFRSNDGRYCRGFEAGSTSGIACRTEGNWDLVQTRSSKQVSGTQYRQAGSAQADIMAAAQEMATGGALDADAEKAARDKGWRD